MITDAVMEKQKKAKQPKNVSILGTTIAQKEEKHVKDLNILPEEKK